MAVRIRIDWSQNLQLEELITKAMEKIEGVYVIYQIRSKNTELPLNSTSQGDVSLNRRQTAAFWNLQQEISLKVSGVPL